MPRRLAVALTGAAIFALAGCATESSRTIQVEKTQAATTPYAGTRLPMSVGKFDNRSSYMRGVFSDGVDRLAQKAQYPLARGQRRIGRKGAVGVEAVATGQPDDPRPQLVQRRTIARRGSRYCIR